MNVRNRLMIPALFAVILTSSGCVKLWQDSLDVKTYMIEAPRDGTALNAPLADKLLIDTVAVLPPYNVRSLIIRKNDVEYEASYYTELLLSPADNVRNILFTWFSASGIFDDVSIAGRKEMSHRLSVTLLKLHGRRFPEGNEAVMALKATLFDERAEGANVLFSRDYEHSEPVDDIDAGELVRAYNRALTQILKECEADVVAALKPVGQM